MTSGPRVLFLSAFAIGLSAQSFVVSTVAGGSPPLLTKPTAISLQPDRVATDAAGNIYFGSGPMLLKLDASGNLTRIAGTARIGCSGDGGPAILAQISSPVGIALDSHGNLYFADSACDTVRKIDTSGQIATVAGTGAVGYAGDNGPATQAKLFAPAGIAIDSRGDLFIADSQNYVVREVIASSGTILTYAGSGLLQATTDNVPARQSSLLWPVDVVFDSSGNLYIADETDSKVRVVNPQGVITTLAGTKKGPVALAWDPASQSLYILQNLDAIYVVSGGIIRVFAGVSDFNQPSLQDGQSAAGAFIDGTGIATDPAGNVIVAASQIWRVSKGLTASLLAGNGDAGYSGDGGPALSAQFWPNSVTVDAAGNLYVSDQSDRVIRKITNGVIGTFAGTGALGVGGDGGPARAASLAPASVAFDKNGNAYVADSSDAVVRKISPAGTITTVAGNYTSGIQGDGQQAVNAQLVAPVATAVDGKGNLFISDHGACTIREVTPDGIIHTIAGRLTETFEHSSAGCFDPQAGDGGPALNANLNWPGAIAVDAAGDVWFVENGSQQSFDPRSLNPFGADYIREITPDGILHIVAGQGSSTADNVPASSEKLPHSTTTGLALDTAGNVYFTTEHTVRRIDSKGILTTIAGSGAAGYSGDGGPATAASFQWITAIASSSGNLYVADQGAGAIRMLTPAATPPPPPAGPVVLSVTNAASNLAGSIAPGEIVTIYGSGLAATGVNVAAPNAAGVYPTVLGGTSVLFNGTPAPMIYTTATQVAAVVPYKISGASVQVSVQYQNVTGEAVGVPLAAASPALFTADSSGKGQAAAVNQDGTLNGAAHPIAPGGTIILFATGEGATNPSGVDGTLTGLPLPVTIGGITVSPAYAGEAPQEIAGLMQLNVVVPASVTPGPAVPVTVQVGNALSPAGVTVAVAASSQ